MKKLITILTVLFSLLVKGQTYDPTTGTVTNKPIGLNAAAATDSRSYFYSTSTFSWRPYANRAEILSYLNLAKYRTGQFDIIMDSASQRWVLYFRNGTTDADLVYKIPISGGSGTVNTGNQFQLGYYAANGTVISPLTLITGSRAVVTNANGLPIAATTTATEIGYVNGVTSSIQTQLNGKQATGNYMTATTGDVVATGPGSVSATIQANAVTTSKIINSAVTLPKLANGTANTLIGYNGSGVPSVITAGTNITISAGAINATSGGANDSLSIFSDSFYTNSNVSKVAIPFTSFRNKKVRLISDGAVFSNSYGNGYPAPAGKGWVDILGSRFAITMANYSGNGRGLWLAAQQANLNISPTDTTIGFWDAAFNDLRRDTALGTYRMIASTLRSVLANFLNETITEGNSLSKTGSWTSTDFQSYGGKSTNGVFSSTNGNYVELAFSGDAIQIAYLNRVTPSFAGGDIQVSVDGTPIDTVTATATSGVSDGTFDDLTCPGAMLYTGLGSGSHTIRLTKINGDYIYIDYIATVKPPGSSFPVLVSLIPKMNAAGYAISPNKGSNAAFNKGDSVILNTMADYIYWDMSVYYPNDFYNPNISAQVDADNIHPSTLGYLNLANGWAQRFYVPSAASGGGGGGGSQNLQQVTDIGYTTTNTILAADGGFGNYNPAAVKSGPLAEIGVNTPTMQAYLFGYDRTALSNLDLVIQGPGGKTMVGGGYLATFNGSEILNVQGGIYTTSYEGTPSSRFGVSISPTTAPLVGSVGASNPFLSYYKSGAPTNQKIWRTFINDSSFNFSFVDDANTTDFLGLKLIRSGTTMSGIQIGKLPTTSTVPDSVMYWDRTNNQVYLAPLGSITFDNPNLGDTLLVPIDASNLRIKSLIASNGLTSITNDSTVTHQWGGTLTQNTTITGANNNVTFATVGTYRLNSSFFTFAKNNATFPYTGAIGLTSGNYWQLGFLKAGVTIPAIIIDTNNNVSIGTSYSNAHPLYATGSALIAENGFLSHAGNFYYATTITSNATIDLTYYWINIDATGGNVTITLPAASAAFGQGMGIQYAFKRIDNSANTVTISRAGSDTIDGATSITLTTQWELKELQCTSTSTWNIK